MRKLLLLCVFFLMVLAVAVTADDDYDCRVKCKEGPYRECLATGASEDACYRQAYEPCAAQCPYEAEPAVIAPVAIARPVVVEDCPSRCKMLYDDCVAAGRDPAECEKTVAMCIREKCGEPTPLPQPVPLPKPECPPQLPEAGCEIPCAHAYYECVRKAHTVNDVEEQKRMLTQCREGVGDCLDRCRPGIVPRPLPPVADCEHRCDALHKECLGRGGTDEECAQRARVCRAQCPQPVEDIIAAPGIAALPEEAVTKEGREMPPEAEAVPEEEAPPMPPRGFWARLRALLGLG